MKTGENSLLQSALQAHGRGDIQGAERLYRRMMAEQPENFDAVHLLGVARAQQGFLGEAERLILQALALNPGHAEAQSNLGNVLSELGRTDEAVIRFQQALKINPGYAEAAFNLGNALLRAQRFAEAAHVYTVLLNRRPDFNVARSSLAGALRNLGRLDEALAEIRRYLAGSPRDPAAHNTLGLILREMGQSDQAAAAFDQALALDPSFTEPYLHLVSLRGIDAGDPRLGAMEALARRADLRPDRRSLLLFALGQAYERLGRNEAAFRHLLEANRLRRAAIAYDEGAARRRFERLQRVFTPALMAEKRGQGCDSDLPIFIIGFPRSGTSLAEQILASHPAVHGAGELGFMGRIAAGLTAPKVGGPVLASEERRAPAIGDGAALHFPECLSLLPAAELRRLGESYASQLQALVPPGVGAKRHVIDKLPENYMFVGLIRLILPRARIIHLRRDPLDICLSCFAQHFAGDLSYAYDLAEIGRYHRMYLDLMEHWRRLLPARAILEVDYESLVADTEGQTRRMLEHCGLTWDARCLDFHETRRPVRTASVDQVRRPVYGSSVGRWRQFEAQLRPLIEALAGDSTIDRRGSLPVSRASGAPLAAAPPAEARAPVPSAPVPSAPGPLAFAPAAPPSLGLDPAGAQALLDRALRAHREGKLAMADKLYRRLLDQRPGDFNALNLLGVIRAQQRRFPEAEALLVKAAAANPENPEARNNLGNVRLELGRAAEAADCFRRAIALRPAYAEAQYNLGNALCRLEMIDAATAAYRAALALRPDYRDALYNLADHLRRIQQPEPAIELLRRLLELHPRDAEAYGLLGTALRQLGRLDEAMAALDKALALNPRLAGIHYIRASTVPVAVTDPQLKVMETLLRQPQGLSDLDRSLLHVALGKAYENLGRYDEAFASLLAGKRLQRRLAPFDEAANAARFESTERVFTPALLAGLAGSGSASELPVLVLGFPRSGTTLVEQILASHPKVHGAGELGFLDHVAANFRAAAVPGFGYPDYMARLTAAERRALGESYVGKLRGLAPAAARITDKLPENYLNIGLVHLTLPRARIIHVKRDPLDTCVSCFGINFSGELRYTSDLGELGRVYRRYLDLMSHWRRLLPPGAMLEIRYEELVDDLEAQARRLIDYCGLAWDPRCIAFHETERSVRTASVIQVRQPLYRSSLQRWRRFEKYLGPLIEALGPEASAEALRPPLDVGQDG
jgi:tetratricopeptide (TPR) repeat protein